MLRFSSVLVAVDGSPPAHAAIDVACALIGSGGQLTILHVYPTHALLSGRRVHSEPQGADERQLGIAALGIARDRARSDYHIEPKIEAVDGDAIDAILSSAEQNQSDAIVLGSRGLSGLQRMLLGSVAEGVMNRSPRPVIIVHIPQ